MNKDELEKNDISLKGHVCVYVTQNSDILTGGGIYFRRYLELKNTQIRLEFDGTDDHEWFNTNQMKEIYAINNPDKLKEELKGIHGIEEEYDYLTYNDVDISEIISICKKYEIKA